MLIIIIMNSREIQQMATKMMGYVLKVILIKSLAIQQMAMEMKV
jgi:hypothetical protein